MVVGDMLLRNATKFGGKKAVVSGGLSINYQELNQRVNRLANALVDKELKKGDHIGVLVHNCHQFIEIYFAAAKTGSIFCPYNNLLKENELLNLIDYSMPKFLFFGADYGEVIESLKSRLKSVECYICLQKSRWSFVEDYEALVSMGEPTEPGIKVLDDDLANIFFTAGTTGRPKGAMRTHRHAITNAIAGVIELKVSYDERVLVTFPMYHISFEDNLCRHFFMSNTIVIKREEHFDAVEVLGLLSKEKITMCQFVPTMIHVLLQCPSIDRFDLGHLRLILYAAAPMPVALLKRALERFKCGFAQLYGQTESGPLITMLHPEDHLIDGSETRLNRLLSSGKPVVCYEVRIVDDTGRDLPVGEVGEIICRSEAMMEGYWQLPKETAEKLKDGWLYTGDLGKYDEGGYIYIVERKDDMIISGGKNIYPREIEEVLYQHRSVSEVSVIGVPDEYWGEAVKAIIVPKENVTISEEDIKRFCEDHLTSYKKPKSVEFWKELPKSPQGKILKRAIRDRYVRDSSKKD